MLRSIFTLLWVCCFTGLLSAQLNITLVEVPSNTPLSDPIYLAGSFNNWDEAHPDYVLTNNGNQTYSITIDPSPGLLEFKFTRGSWTSVEGNAGGGFQPNHTFDYSGNPSELELTILSWEDLGPAGTGPSTASDNVMILDQDFY
ncbi:MAG: glycogen-binding domain-containing protein, partial [Bacteroidota bacterium]